MKMQKLLALFACLCLICSAAPALAAPARDIQVMDVLLNDGLQTLVNIIAAAIPEECFGDQPTAVLADGEAPGAILVEQALTAAVLYARPTTVLTKDEAANLYRQIFTNGEFILGDSPLFLTPAKDGVETHPELLTQQGGAGTRIYSAAFDGTDVALKCDLYYMEYASVGGYQAADVEELPEDTVTWACNAEMTLRFAPETEFGYTLSSLSLSPVYQDGNVSLWQDVDNTQYEYSVTLPAILGLAEEEPAHMSWQTAGGDAALTVDVTDETAEYDVALSRFMQAHPGMAVSQQRDFGYFCALGEDCFILVYAGEGMNWNYTLTLSFPAERLAEYSLYAEFIRNSMIVWGLSNG